MILRSSGKSLLKIWSCKATLAVLTTSVLSSSRAMAMPGMRYDRVFPTPVGASIARCRPSSPASVFATSAIICRCGARGIKSGICCCSALYQAPICAFSAAVKAIGKPEILYKQPLLWHFLFAAAKRKARLYDRASRLLRVSRLARAASALPFPCRLAFAAAPRIVTGRFAVVATTRRFAR